MKIALLFKGPVRPDYKTCYDNYMHIKNQFENYDKRIEFDDYLFAWNSEESAQFAKIIKNVILMNEPNNENIVKNLLKTKPTTNFGCASYNAYKHFLGFKVASDFIINTNVNYDYVLYFRIDTKYDLLNISSFFEPNHYVCSWFESTYSELKGQKTYYDFWGCASPDIFKKAWDYENLENLNLTYSNSMFPEDWLKKNLIKNNINVKFVNLRWYPHYCDDNVKYDINVTLNPNRKNNQRI